MGVRGVDRLRFACINKKMTEELVPLSDLREGDEGIIQTLTGGRALSARLAGLGIALNMRIKVLRSRGELKIVQAADTRVALGGGEADKIFVYRTDPQQCESGGEKREGRKLLVALAGQPNVGKSTVFNILTGLSQHVGNWPGKTVEKKEGAHVCDDAEMRIVDLPGTYSLTAFSPEERIARDFILTERPDVIVLLVNAAALERSIYLLTELLLLGPPVIVAVNMVDVAENQGIRINIKALEQALGIPVVEMVAAKNRGIRELVEKTRALACGDVSYAPRRQEVAADHRDVFLDIISFLTPHFAPCAPSISADLPVNWLAIKLMEGDLEIAKIVEARIPPDAWRGIQSILLKHEDSLHAVVGGRYDWIEAVTRAAISRFRMGQVVMTDRIDHILTRPLFGIPVLLTIFAVVFLITYKVGYPLQRGLEGLVSAFAKQIEPFLEPYSFWIKGMLIDGVIGGAGSVLTFIPILVIFFTFMAVLEDVGYMARAAFVMDRFMHLIGLHGKSVIPMCLGFGCNVPAVLGARIVESRKERLLTIFLSPFVPCTARLAVLTFVAAAIFSTHAALVSWSLLTVNILVLGLVGMLVSRYLLKDEAMPFIMELPLYHKPDFKTIGMAVWARTLSFIKKAGTVILAVSVILWLLSHLPHGRIEDSLLAGIGRFIEPLGQPLGLDWKMITALLTTVIAKETAIATLGVLYGVGREGLLQVLPQVMSPASALSFLVIMMLFIPCAATVAVMRREMDSWKWFGASIGAMLVLSLLGGLIAYRIALSMGW
ncbi:MAG: ferrous iron transport protein B [Deltaproteobacteria bacterium HGW-Deltaproteobacteria-9]|nr:MAG: ferrous iron transport protein B [Deltaproteobacteria bacterium HGW-Deltaproteobacteria-9]